MANKQIPPAVSEFMAEIGRKGGQSKSERKLAAIRRNARRAGRKLMAPEKMTDAQKKRQARYLAKKNKTDFTDL